MTLELDDADIGALLFAITYVRTVLSEESQGASETDVPVIVRLAGVRDRLVALRREADVQALPAPRP